MKKKILTFSIALMMFVTPMTTFAETDNSEESYIVNEDILINELKIKNGRALDESINTTDNGSYENISDEVVEQQFDLNSFELDFFHSGDIPQKYIYENEYDNSMIDDIQNGLYSRQSSIDISRYGVTVQDGLHLYELVVNSNPDMYFILNTVTVESHNNTITSFIPNYKEDDGISLAQTREVDAEIARILGYVKSDMSDLEKALTVHDYFVRNYEYDYSYSRYTMEDIFTDKKGVCQAYADAYTYIMNKKLGIKCYTVSSEYLNHAWNIISIDNKWYYIDTTWDDPTFNNSDYFGSVRHMYFLISEEKINTIDEGSHYCNDVEIAWTNDLFNISYPSGMPTVNSTFFDDYFWQYTEYCPIIYYNSLWYYVQNGYICSLDFKTGECKQIKSIDTYYMGSFDIYNGTIIYKDYFFDTVYTCTIDGVLENTIDELNGVYGFRVKGDILEYVYDSNDVMNYDLNNIKFKLRSISLGLSNQTNSGKNYNLTISGSAVDENVDADLYMIQYDSQGLLKSCSILDVKNQTVFVPNNNGKTKFFIWYRNNSRAIATLTSL